MDHKTLFPVLEIGFFVLDIHLKPAKGTDYRLWQGILKLSKTSQITTM